MTAYYNEIDPFAAQWLRNLIAANLIAPGDVDERSVENVSPLELTKYTQCHFFAGIGGWSYALRLAGWPDDKPVWTGSCPCQPFSVAGKGAGFNDERHLWPAWFNLTRQCRPPVIFGEQVEAAIRQGWLDTVFSDLEGEGHACGATVLPACSVGAPHIRQRLWFVADNAEPGRQPWRHYVAGTAVGTQDEARERERIRIDIGAGGYSGGLADADSQRCNGERLCLQPEAVGRDAPDLLEASGSGEARELGNASSARLQERERHGRIQREAVEPREGQATVGGSDIGCMEHASGVRRQRRETAGGWNINDGPASERQTGATGRSSAWRDLDWLPCTDGKTRPVEPGTFPLAHGIPGRVGRLRAYGNAIIPQVAAEFIAAYMALGVNVRLDFPWV